MCVLARWLAVAVVLGSPAIAQAQEALDPLDLSLEELLEVEVYSTSEYVRSVRQSPSRVTTVTAEEIKAQGYQTIADILRAFPGLYITYDREYSYLGTRGLSREEDYNTRILFLVDGHRLNENIYESMLLGTEAILDVELIDRLEFIPGPGAAILHGQNAFFGVVNIVTKAGAHVDGFQLAGDVGSAGTTKLRATYGKQLDNGLDILLSASRYNRDGRDLYFEAFKEAGGVAQRGWTMIGRTACLPS